MIACRTSGTKPAIVDFVDFGRSMNFSGLVGSPYWRSAARRLTFGRSRCSIDASIGVLFSCVSLHVKWEMRIDSVIMICHLRGCADSQNDRMVLMFDSSFEQDRGCAAMVVLH